MSVYEGIMRGLNEAVEYTEAKNKEQETKEIERLAKEAEEMREAYQSTVEHKGENALCIEKFYLKLWTAAAEALREKLERTTKDAVPVVRCGECKHYTLGPFGKGCMVHFNHKTDIFTHTPDDYCSYGEKKEDL